MAKKGRGKYYAIGGIIVVLAVIFMYGDSIDLDNVANTAGNSGINLNPSQSQTGAIANGVYQVYGENFNVQTQTKDSLDVSITYGDDTELDTLCWNARGSDDPDDWILMPGGTFTEAETGDANIDLTAGKIDSEGNVIETGTLEMWCEFNLESSQDYFVDHAKIIDVNDEIDTCLWVDANDDTDETFACRYDLSEVTRGESDPNNEPFDAIQIFLFDEETDSGDQTIMDTSVASATSIAQTDTTTELLTHLDFNNAADAVVITEILFRNNLTSSSDSIFKDGTTDICFQDSTANMVWFDTREPVGCLTIGDTDIFDFDQLASTQEYRWEASGYNEGILVTVPKNSNTQVDTTLTVGTDFTASTDAICVELSYKYADAFENESSSDAVDIEVTAASSVGDECTIS